MVMIPLGTNDWASPLTNVLSIRLHNMYLVDNPLSPDGVSRISRPTLDAYSEVGSGPIEGIWQQDGSFNGDYFVLSGGTLYRLSEKIFTAIGDIPGTGSPVFAGNTDTVIVVRDGGVYRYDGTTLGTVAMPDSLPVSSVDCIDSVFVFTIENTQLFYWMNPGESSPDGLSFASAERTPDPLVSVAVMSDEIWFLGSQSMEVWASTGNGDAPYARIAARVYRDGCIDKASVVKTIYNGIPALIWVTDKKAVVMAQGAPNRISNDAIEEALRSSYGFTAWGFRQNRHDFYVLSCSGGTFVFDITKGTWARWDSYGKKYWMARVGCQRGQDVLVGGPDSNKIYSLSEGISDDGLPVVREVSGFVIHAGNQTPVNSVNVRVNSGWSTDEAEETFLELRWSDDYGATWSRYIKGGMGTRGDFAKDVTFRSLGMMFRPGREFEIRYTGLDRFRLDYATLNEV